MDAIQILIVDDHEVVRDGLAVMLARQEDFPGCWSGVAWSVPPIPLVLGRPLLQGIRVDPGVRGSRLRRCRRRPRDVWRTSSVE